jgi:hypothetical protein
LPQTVAVPALNVDQHAMHPAAGVSE